MLVKGDEWSVMSPALSIYLDLVRFAAAFIVFLSHAAFSNYSSGWLSGFSEYGPQAVMVFFVLSGFVITYVTDTRTPSTRRFITDRAARIYSVALPALLVTCIADKIGMTLDPQLYYCCIDYGNPILDIAVSSLFLNEIWFYGLQPFSNGPSWSISYEVAYYVLFAVLLFAPTRWRFPMAGLTCLVIGPPILLLAPVWFIGVGAYYITRSIDGSLGFGLLLFAGSIVAFLMLDVFDIPQSLQTWTDARLGETGVAMLRQSRFVLTDYLLGLVVACNFVGAVMIGRNIQRVPEWLGRPIRYMAGFTFSLYLYHLPLLLVFSVVLDHDPASAFDQAILYTLTLVTVWLLGLFTEQKKDVFREVIDRAWNVVTRTLRPPAL